MPTLFKFPDSIEDFCIACVPVGSRVTCNPPPTDTDQDILCLVAEDEEEGFFSWIEQHDWVFEGDAKYDLTNFTSYRKDTEQGEVNLIVTAKPQWFDAFLDATRECKEKNLLKKSERIEVFEKYIPQNKKVSKASKKIKQALAEIMAEQQAASAAYNTLSTATLQNQAFTAYNNTAASPSSWWATGPDLFGGFSESN